MFKSVTRSRNKKAAGLIGIIKQLGKLLEVLSQGPDSSRRQGQVPGAPPTSRGQLCWACLAFNFYHLGSLTSGLTTLGHLISISESVIPSLPLGEDFPFPLRIPILPKTFTSQSSGMEPYTCLLLQTSPPHLL